MGVMRFVPLTCLGYGLLSHMFEPEAIEVIGWRRVPLGTFAMEDAARAMERLK